jgi:ABC-type multidrug transport system ATPase subunit
MTYPVFQPRHLRRIIPSRRFKYGNRPPEGIAALTGIDLVVERGMCGLLGPNGAGKTTLMQIMAGLLKPTRGYVEVNGLNLATDREKLRNRIGYLPQEFGLPAEFTARQFLNYHALMMGLHETAERSRRIESALEEVNLAHTGRQAVGGFSGGMKQRLGIARVLLKLPSSMSRRADLTLSSASNSAICFRG